MAFPLFVPVGGGTTIGAEQAVAIAGRLAPRQPRQRLSADALEIAHVVEVRGPCRVFLQLTCEVKRVAVGVQQLVHEIGEMLRRRAPGLVGTQQSVLTCLAELRKACTPMRT
jgi:hypothetical protein